MNAERGAGSPFPQDPRETPRFTELFQRYVEELQDQGFIDPDAIVEAHPDIGLALVEDLETYIQLRPLGEEEADTALGTLGDYTLRREIGRGGMGVVYEAWENSVGRAVALKVLPAGLAADRRAYARFMREAQAAGQLSHPNLVPVHAAGFKEDTPYYAMEFVEGETLARILTRISDADPETETPFGKKDDTRYFANLAEAFTDVADGLQHAHSKGVTHRDIKPSNLILDQEGRLRILDFGLARLEGQESLTLSGDFVGTPLYMSPEQARRKRIPVDHRTDVYSLGATMYEAICGRPPFRGKDHTDTLSQIIERDPVEPRTLNPRVPKDLETIVLKCLRKVAGDRYGTAEALAQDLKRFGRGDPIEARPQSRWERLARRARRHMALAVTTAVLVVVALVTLVLGTALIWRANEETKEALRQARELADSKRIELLEIEARDFWPALPVRVPDMDRWLSRAEEVVGRGPAHRHSLEAIRAQGTATASGTLLRPGRDEEALRKLLDERKRLLTTADADGGPTPLEATVLSYGTDPRKKHRTCYFRKSFVANDAQAHEELAVKFIVDDGAVVYLNGTEVLRWNMPDGDVGHETWALTGVTPNRLITRPLDLSTSVLREGANLLAVEVHQVSESSSDLHLRLELTGDDDTVLVPLASTWRYDDSGQVPDATWKTADFYDRHWKEGPAPLGYGFMGGPGQTLELQLQSRRRLAAIEDELGRLRERLSLRFPTHDLRWRYDRLEELLAKIERFADPDPSIGTLAAVRACKELALSTYRKTIADRRPDWERAIEEIKASRHYDELELTPQIGLIPLGEDPHSGLWEFAHLWTGAPPQRGPDGKLVVDEEMALILVLVPGGVFSMGAERPSDARGLGTANADPAARDHESPVHEVQLDAFFISKYEMTQAQWELFTGANPSELARGGLYPVERVSWEMCEEVLGRMGLALPTEAQWEYAARGGTSSVWWTGNDAASLRGAANLSDEFWEKVKDTVQEAGEGPVGDQHSLYSPVGQFRPNAFGLHDVIGNVWEWCRDRYGPYEHPVLPGTGERLVEGEIRISRGGGFSDGAEPARSASRTVNSPTARYTTIGVRPVRTVTRQTDARILR